MKMVIRLFLLLIISYTEIFGQSSTITLWKDSVIGAIYNDSTQSVAYGRKDANGYFKIYISDTLGNNEVQLTWPGWDTNRHQWAEEWHPSGDYLFCYVEKTPYVAEVGHTRIPDDAVPGYGGYTDIWLIKRDGSLAWQLTNFPNDYNHGVIHGAISRDGTKFAWSERTLAPNIWNPIIAAGGYIMRVADLVLTPTPILANIQSYQPGGIDATNELESFSNDNSTLAFYSTFESANLIATPVYTINLTNSQITQLTTASFAQAPTFTLDGGHLIYMTGDQCDIFPWEIQGADWWIMDALGNNKHRISRMNVTNDPQSVNHYRLAGSISIMGNHSFLGGVMTQPLGLTGHTVKVQINPSIGFEETKEVNFYFYPNPSTDYLIIHLINPTEDEWVEIYNSWGQLVKKNQLSYTTYLDLSILSSGVYYINLGRHPNPKQMFIKN